MNEEESAKTTETAETQEQVVEAQVDTTAYEDMIAAKDAEIANLQKVVADKDAGLKKYKSIAKGRDDWSDDDEEAMTPEKYRQIAREESEKTLAESTLAKALQEKDDLVQKALRENKELKLTLANRPSSTPQGAGADTTEAATAEIIPADMLAKFKAEGKSEAFLDRLRAQIRTGGHAPLEM